MTNLDALKAQCKLICNTCYVDDDVARLILLNEGLYPEEDATLNNPLLIRSAIVIVKGWVENSRSENGISVSCNIEEVSKSISYWCKVAGLDTSEYNEQLTTVENWSNKW